VSSGESLKIVVIGLGHQSLDDHLPAIRESTLLTLVGVVDIDEELARRVAEEEGVDFGTSPKELLAKLTAPPDVALVAIPHHGHTEVVEFMARNGIHIIKEKPFAISMQDALRLVEIIIETGVSIQVTLQRRFNPIFLSFRQLLKRIGRVHSVEARYTLNVERLDEGWRASRLYAGGGALIDLGYHYVDLLVWYFGLPTSITCTLSTGNREDQNYDVEDTAHILMTYGQSGAPNCILGSLIVSRVYPDKDEALVAFGTTGSAAVQRGRVLRRDLGGNTIECLERTGAWPSALVDQLDAFAGHIVSGDLNGQVDRQFLEHVAFVEAAYRSAQAGAAQDPQMILNEALRTLS